MNFSLEPADFFGPEFEQALRRTLEKILPSVVSQLAKAQPEKLLVNADPAAELLSMSRRTLDALTAKGEIPVVRATSRPQYSPADLQAWIDLKKRTEDSERE